jgi:hypothetical protein
LEPRAIRDILAHLRLEDSKILVKSPHEVEQELSPNVIRR